MKRNILTLPWLTLLFALQNLDQVQLIYVGVRLESRNILRAC